VARHIYLDESGDLGWSFDLPYRYGGSSRYLTIAALCVPTEKRHIAKRLVRSLYRQFGWLPSAEKKWKDMQPGERAAFATALADMCTEHPDIHIDAITVKKQRVEPHIRRDENKLYNYMIWLSLADCMAAESTVTLVPDPRSIKVESGNSLHDYLQTQLWFERKATTQLTTRPLDSKASKEIQLADMAAGLIQHSVEDKYFNHIRECVRHLRLRRLFFG
jgi:hypothetical protein